MKIEWIDYRKLRLNNINTTEFRHLWLLLYWALYGFMFRLVETNLYPADRYTPMYHPLDDLIPFCEWFVIPYVFWFAYLAAATVLTLLADREAFKKMMYFQMITYSVTILIYLVFPNCQELRPETFPRDNALTRFMAAFYATDTNTNVFPSLHVIGSFASMLGLCKIKAFDTKGWWIVNWVICILISMATVCLKQHSILDVCGAIPLMLIAWWLIYKRKGKKNVKC